MNFLIVNTSAQLTDFCSTVPANAPLAIDTEFIRERTYYPQLCLVQIAHENAIAIIDPLAIADLEPLRELLLDTSHTKIFHAARQDMEIFYHLWNTLPEPIFDTQVAAGMLGEGDQVGYAKLIKSMLNVELDKTQSRTDWSLRPLSDKQLQYAADDVRYLLEVYSSQRQALESQNRLDWVRSDFDILTEPATYVADPMSMWEKLKGVQRLKNVELSIAQQLAAWREQEAQKKNRPRRHIISDDAVIDLAHIKPRAAESFQKLRSLNGGQVSQYGEQLLSLIKAGTEVPRTEWPRLQRNRPTNVNEEAIVDALSSVLKLLANHHNIHPNRVAGRQDLLAFVQNEPDAILARGWRYDHFGADLKRFLHGEIQLSVKNGQLGLM